MPNSVNEIFIYNDYSSFVKKTFKKRVQKISVDAGFTCPNRDGSISNIGCIYCANESFSPFYCNPQLSINEQLQKGIAFFSSKYKTQEYLAYFQSYTNTYSNIEDLRQKYLEALSVDGVRGLVISTRPDCINKQILEMINDIAGDKYVCIEFGSESTNNRTLELINRGHTWEDTINAVKITSEYGFYTCLHIILGLPGENEYDFYEHARKISLLPVNFLKIHHLQILNNTPLLKLFKENPQLFINLELDNYIKIVCDFVERLSPEIIIERFTGESPLEMIIYPKWQGKKNYEITHMIVKELQKRNSWQGKYFKNDKF